ncbi:hypothetical protein Tamer19_40420 [Cupriavidus sp. TA19]|nr:hypothetical protein Tamer19_40420 [Cupriavidus sp. TA19]
MLEPGRVAWRVEAGAAPLPSAAAEAGSTFRVAMREAVRHETREEVRERGHIAGWAEDQGRGSGPRRGQRKRPERFHWPARFCSR